MKDEMINVDVEKIMDEISISIKNRNYKHSELSFKDITIEDSLDLQDNFNVNEFNNNIYEINQYYNIQLNNPINGRKIVRFIKRIIRKLTQFYIAPIVDQQKLFNASTVRTLNQINFFIKNQQDNYDIFDNVSFDIDKLVNKDFSLIQSNYFELKKENELLKENLNLMIKRQKDVENKLELALHKLEIVNLKCEKYEFLIEKFKER
jgi:hypothetical protein